MFVKDVKGKRLADVEDLAALENIKVNEDYNSENESDNEDDDLPRLSNVDFNELDAKIMYDRLLAADNANQAPHQYTSPNGYPILPEPLV